MNTRISNIPASNAPASVDDAGSRSSPPTFDVVVGILTLAIALIGVTIGIAQYIHNRAAKAAKRLRETQRQPDQPDVELPDFPDHVPDAEYIDNG